MKLSQLKEASYYQSSKLAREVKQSIAEDTVPDIWDVEDTERAVRELTAVFGPPDHISKAFVTWFTVAVTDHPESDTPFGVDLSVDHKNLVVELY